MKKLFIWLIKFYQRAISPYMGKGKCKFHPTCSQYAIEAIQVHGAFYGLILAIGRIFRCNPFSSGGFDPVPEKKRK